MASSAFTSSNWSNYFTITSDSAKVSANNDNLMYDLSEAPSGFWSTVKSDGGDLRVVNSAGDTAYSFELENFDTTAETGIVFFDSQNLATGSDTTWRIYYGNGSASLPAPSDTLGAQNVWNSNYVLVSHDGGKTDSTSNGHNGTEDGGVSGGGATGQIGVATDFDGNDDRISVESDGSLSPTPSFTFQSWVNADDVSGSGGDGNTIGTVDDTTSGSENGWFMRIDDGEISFWVESDPNRFSLKTGTINTHTWYLVHGLFDTNESNEQKVYIDGSLSGEQSASYSESTTDLQIGSHANETQQFLNGTVDEVRISGTPLSASWISTEYNNQSSPSTFWTTGAEQSSGVTFKPKVLNIM